MTHSNDTTTIPLSRGKVAIIDAVDAAIVAPYTWVAVRSGNRWYGLSRDGGGYLMMHRLLTATDDGFDTDHWDGDGLNNRRVNLRVATRSQNMANVPLRENSRSGFKGVSWHAGAKKWRATIKLNYKQIHLGFFADPADGARAYDAKAREVFGEFAFTNFP